MISPNDIAVRDGGPALYRPPPRDLLRVPLLGRLLRSRHGRLLGQIPLLLVALLLIYDGFTGSPIAPQNLATVSVWVHYRGLVMLAGAAPASAISTWQSLHWTGANEQSTSVDRTSTGYVAAISTCDRSASG